MGSELDTAIRAACDAGLEVNIRQEKGLFILEVMIPEYGVPDRYDGATCFEMHDPMPFDELAGAIAQSTSDYLEETKHGG